MIRLEGIRVRFSETPLLQDVNWHLQPGQRVGLVGDNGAGKTTLLRFLAGVNEPEEGHVHRRPGIDVGWLPQAPDEPEDCTILECVRAAAGLREDHQQQLEDVGHQLAQVPQDGAEAKKLLRRLGRLQEEAGLVDEARQEAEARRILQGLGFTQEDGDRALETFSGGWRMRARLAGLLLRQPDVLLLDEPTNHLDTETTEWLERTLSRYPGTLVVVSHDRWFLDHVCTHIAEVHGQTVRLWTGDFSHYREQRDQQRDHHLAAAQRQARERARVQRFVERFRAKNTKASQVQSRLRQLQKTEVLAVEEEAHGIQFHFPPCPRSGDVVLSCEDLGHSYGAGFVLRHHTLTVERGERVALIGANGSGKSTLVSLLAGTMTPTEGSTRLGHGVRMAWLSQEAGEELDPDQTVLECLTEAGPGMSEGWLRGLLGSFRFSEEAAFRPVSVLSGGERSRLAVARLLLGQANLLILDEPTRHLDEKAREVLQQALAAFEGTLLLVSHDRYFLQGLATRIWAMRPGHLRDHPGTYEEFWNLHAQEAEQQAAATRSGSRQGTTERKEERRRVSEQRIQNRRRIRQQERAVHDLEARVTACEELLATLGEQLSQPALYDDPARLEDVTRKHHGARQDHETLGARWEAEQERLDALREELGEA